MGDTQAASHRHPVQPCRPPDARICPIQQRLLAAKQLLPVGGGRVHEDEVAPAQQLLPAAQCLYGGQPQPGAGGWGGGSRGGLPWRCCPSGHAGLTEGWPHASAQDAAPCASLRSLTCHVALQRRLVVAAQARAGGPRVLAAGILGRLLATLARPAVGLCEVAVVLLISKPITACKTLGTLPQSLHQGTSQPRRSLSQGPPPCPCSPGPLTGPRSGGPTCAPAPQTCRPGAGWPHERGPRRTRRQPAQAGAAAGSDISAARHPE